jgi:hypothetical protein
MRVVGMAGPGLGGGGVGWVVVGVGALAVGADSGFGAVGVEDDFPAPDVDGIAAKNPQRHRKWPGQSSAGAVKNGGQPGTQVGGGAPIRATGFGWAAVRRSAALITLGGDPPIRPP